MLHPTTPPVCTPPPCFLLSIGTCFFDSSCAVRACQPHSPVPTGLMVAQLSLVAGWWLLFVALMWHCRRLLRARPWQLFRTANAAFRLEVGFVCGVGYSIELAAGV